MVSYLVIVLGTIIMAVTWVIRPIGSEINCAYEFIVREGVAIDKSNIYLSIKL